MPPVEHIASRILVVRGQRVMIDADLALLYGVTTRQLNQQVKRNPRGFPPISRSGLGQRKSTRWSQIVTTFAASSIHPRCPSSSPSTGR